MRFHKGKVQLFFGLSPITDNRYANYSKQQINVKNHFYFRQLHVKPLAKQYIEIMISLKIKRQQINAVKSRHLIKN